MLAAPAVPPDPTAPPEGLGPETLPAAAFEGVAPAPFGLLEVAPPLLVATPALGSGDSVAAGLLRPSPSMRAGGLSGASWISEEKRSPLFEAQPSTPQQIAASTPVGTRQPELSAARPHLPRTQAVRDAAAEETYAGVAGPALGR
jgi:hypothetical protein